MTEADLVAMADELQGGRGITAAEVRVIATNVRPFMGSFNEAAALLPRKLAR